LGIVPENAKAICADKFIGDGEILWVGSVEIKAIATPGHTNSHNAYLVNNDRVLTGDSLLIRGCGRTDFQSGNASQMFHSLTKKLWVLPNEILVFPGHDYQGNTVSTIGEEKQWNPRLAGNNESSFIRLMANLNLPNPKKIMEAVPANELCGKVAAKF
jgi:glyoxylase-like metal-dependent hydrolase (beta-lactamase superfamily II)